MSLQLVITRGLPASGKTTLAKQWVANDPGNRVRVNRDDLRQMLHDGVFIKGITEQTVIRMRDRLISESLRTGVSVINDDTNLSAKNVKELAKLAEKSGAEFLITDLTDTTLEECLARNGEREDKDPVPERVILDMHNRYIKGKPYPLSVPEFRYKGERKQYVAPDTLDSRYRSAIIFDIDGTVAHMNGRSPYDYTQVHTDLPDDELITLARHYSELGYFIIFLSGRKSECRADTRDWLHEHVKLLEGLHWTLIMRPDGDDRDDAQVKYELFDVHVRPYFRVLCVYDDRNRVVEMWRSIGLKTYQVAEGNF